ncbi:MAG: IPT/TIG domain-containing protein [Melioribacteraceae bacterium]|nr:IPT/TIG domain-containing protein [Melioribacteraceae bacterium]
MKTNTIIKNIVLTVIAVLILSSCDTDTTPTLYEDLPNGAAPIITSVNPPDSALAGVTEVRIIGQNFSSDASKIIVYFNENVAEILELSSTEILVKTPNFVKDSVNIKISVQGAPLFSDPYLMDVKPSIREIYTFQDFEVPYALTTDRDRNILFSYTSNGLSAGIGKISPSKEITEFSPKGGESFYTEIRYGSNGKVYGTRKPPVRAMFGSEAGVAPKAIAVEDRNARLLALDIDQNNNIWVGGIGGNIYRITPDEADQKAFVFEPEIQSIRVFNGYLYTVATIDSIQSIWRMQIITSDSLGPAENYYSLTQNLKGFKANTITFSESGELFIGTSAPGNNPNALVYLTPEKNLKQWYANVISGPIINMTWDSNKTLYYTREKIEGTQNQLIMGVNMDKKGAPYFGRD